MSKSASKKELRHLLKSLSALEVTVERALSEADDQRDEDFASLVSDVQSTFDDLLEQVASAVDS